MRLHVSAIPNRDLGDRGSTASLRSSDVGSAERHCRVARLFGCGVSCAVVSAARVAAFGDAPGAAFLLDDEETVVSLDDLFDVVLVAREDDEATRVCAHGIVVPKWDVDALCARVLAAFADEGHAVGELIGALAEAADLFVDLAEKRLVAAGTFFRQVHPVIFASSRVTGGSRRGIGRSVGEMSAREHRNPVRTPDAIRAGNERIAERAKRLQFVSRVPMLCECDDPACSQIVLIALDAYQQVRRDRRRYLTAPNHTLGAATVETKTDAYWLQRP
jgi:hypothetical protein